MYRLFKLNNGITILYEKVSKSKAVALELAFGVGSAYETLENNGISHFLEHMIFSGTNKYSKSEIAERVANLGGVFSAYTGKFSTHYSAVVRVTEFTEAIDLLAEIIGNSSMSEDAIAREKEVIKVEMIDDTPTGNLIDNFNNVKYQNCALAQTVIGTEKNVDCFVRQDLMTHLKNYYQANNCVISIVGDLECKDVIRLLEEKFNFMKPGNVRNVSELDYSSEHNFLIIERACHKTYLYLEFDAPGYVDLSLKDNYILMILNRMLGDSEDALLFNRIRLEKGLVYSIFSSFKKYPQNSPSYIYTSCKQENLNEVFIELIDLLKRFTSGECQLADKFEMVKKRIKIDSDLTSELNISKCERNLQTFQYRFDNLSDKDRCKLLDSITLQDVLDFAKQIYKLDNMSVALTGRYDEKNTNLIENTIGKKAKYLHSEKQNKYAS